jgi:hypothetical protein
MLPFEAALHENDAVCGDRSPIRLNQSRRLKF